jgi:hypothetical protein
VGVKPRPTVHVQDPAPVDERRGPAPVHVHIDELRLDGFDPRDRHGIAGALQRELARLFREHADRAARPGGEAFEAPEDADRIDGGSFAFRAGESPHRIGVAIARATFRGLTASRGRKPGPHGA